MNPAHIEALVPLWKQEGWAPDLRRLEGLKTAAEMSQNEYAEAWLWVHWMLESEPRRRVLQTYLGDLRREGTTPPLSVYLRQLGGNPDAALVEHLKWLDERK